MNYKNQHIYYIFMENGVILLQVLLLRFEQLFFKIILKNYYIDFNNKKIYTYRYTYNLLY